MKGFAIHSNDHYEIVILYASILTALLYDPFYTTQDRKNSELLVPYFLFTIYCHMQQLATHKDQN